jgi:hypothetical protein
MASPSSRAVVARGTTRPGTAALGDVTGNALVSQTRGRLDTKVAASA